MTRQRLALPLAACLLWAGSALAIDYTLGPLVIGQPWAHATAATAPGGAAYLTIRNTGTTPDRLIAARSAASGLVQMHEMKMDGDVMRMRELDNGIEIPAGGTVTLAPGGLHLMMMGLKEPMLKDSKVPMTLTFEKAGKIDVEFAVEGLGATQPPRSQSPPGK